MDLLQPRLGAEVEWASDEFFAPRHRLIQPEDPVWRPGVYDEHGKWMDGWETRRRRGGGDDSCIVRLGLRGIVRGVDIDTTYFDGNQPTAATIETWDGAGSPAADARWWPLIPRAPLGPSQHHRIAAADDRPATHLRLLIHPDGGVARLRAYGEVVCDWSRRDPTALWDLAAAENGGQAVLASDQHFGSMHNLLLPGRGKDMGDGWETRRRRGPGHDWVILRLGHPGSIERVELDTAHFKGNYPDRASLQAAFVVPGAEPSLATLAAASESWPVLLPERKLEPDRIHELGDALVARVPGVMDITPSARINLAPSAVSHVRLNIFPDGGVSRLRLFGHLDPAASPDQAGRSRR
jgi:allantoicase